MYPVFNLEGPIEMQRLYCQGVLVKMGRQKKVSYMKKTSRIQWPKELFHAHTLAWIYWRFCLYLAAEHELQKADGWMYGCMNKLKKHIWFEFELKTF